MGVEKERIVLVVDVVKLHLKLLMGDKAETDLHRAYLDGWRIKYFLA